jgi:DUF4097 and DUF4098 domain-containing protein YvlB
VKSSNIDGDITITNSFNPVKLKQTAGSIIIRSQSGSVNVSDFKILPATATIDILTTFEKIELNLPAGTEAAVQAKTSFGKIESDYPVYMNSSKPLKVKAGQVIIKLETDSDIIVREGSK